MVCYCNSLLIGLTTFTGEGLFAFFFAGGLPGYFFYVVMLVFIITVFSVTEVIIILINVTTVIIDDFCITVTADAGKGLFAVLRAGGLLCYFLCVDMLAFISAYITDMIRGGYLVIIFITLCYLKYRVASLGFLIARGVVKNCFKSAFHSDNLSRKEGGATIFCFRTSFK